MIGKAIAGAAAAAVLAVLTLPGLGAAEEAYDIHVVVSLTGGGSFLGLAEKQAIELAEKAFNSTGGIHGRPIRFIYLDDQSNPQTAVQAANEALADHPAVVLGSSLVASCNAMAPLMRQGPLLYCFSPGIHPSKGSFAYTSSVSTRDYGEALIRFFRLKGWTRLALMTSTDATGQDADHDFDELLNLPENRDIQVVAHPHFNVSDVSISAQIETVKAAQLQVFVAWSTGAPIATVFRAMMQGGLDVPVATTGGNMTYAQMKQFAAFLPKALYMPSSEWPAEGDPNLLLDPGVAAKQTQFFAAFAAAGLKPDEGAVLSWDPALLVVDALRALPAGATAVQLNDYFQTLKGQAGIDGVYDFNAAPQRGLGIMDTIVTRWSAASAHWDVVLKPGGVPLDH